MVLERDSGMSVGDSWGLQSEVRSLGEKQIEQCVYGRRMMISDESWAEDHV